ncbi:MAG: hypothetical protein GAK45_00484 [Pseudomonas citronellolis]|nr:MAG: hypothetical protein GAK45_00484 [Pseudomonas citronellolis]
MPFLFFAAHRVVIALRGGFQELVGDVRLQAGVVVAQPGHEGPVVPVHLVLGEQRVGVDGRIGEVAAAHQYVLAAHRAGGAAVDAHCQAGAAALTVAGDLLALEGGAVGQHVIGLAEAEGLVQLQVEDPVAFLVQGVAGAQHLAGDRVVELGGALVGLGLLVVEAPVDVVGHRAIEAELVVDAEAFTGDGVVAGAPLVHAAGQDRRRQGGGAVAVRAAVSAALVGIGVVLVVLVGQCQARALGVVPAELGEDVGGAHVLGVGFGAGDAVAAGMAVGLGLVAVALADVEQGVEVVVAAGHGGRGQPAFIGRAVAGLQACANIAAVLDDVVRVEGEVAHRAADGVAAIQCRGRAAQHFHALDDFRIDVVALGLRVGAVEEAGRYFDAVDLGQDAVAVDAADVVAGDAGTLAGTADRHAGHVADQVLDAVDVVAVELGAVGDIDGARHQVDVTRLAGGGHGLRLQFQGLAVGRAHQHHVTRADLVVFQAGAEQQAGQCFIGGGAAADAGRGHAFGQLGAQADLPAGDRAECVQRRGQRLAVDGEVVAGLCLARLGSLCGGGRQTGHGDGNGQQRQAGGGTQAAQGGASGVNRHRGALFLVR